MSEQLSTLIQTIRERWDPQFELTANEFVPWTPWHTPVSEGTVALVSTGGVYLKHGMHQPYDLAAPGGDPSFREFPAVIRASDLEVAHTGFDTAYARQDVNVVFPLERLQELVSTGYVGSMASFAYSFMGNVTRPASLLANYAPSVAYRLKRMGPSVALIVAAGLVDHITAGIVARAVELAGVPTIVLGTDRTLLEAVKVPRAVLVRHPDGATLGNPGNAGKHQHLLLEVFEAAWQFEGPGMITELRYAWNGR